MIRPNILLLAIAAIIPSFANAQTPAEVRRSATSGVDFYTTNYGIFGLNVGNGNAGLFYPRGSGTIAYLYGSGLWFGAQKTVDDTVRKLTVMTYDPNSGQSWMKPGAWTNDPTPDGPSYDQLAYSPEYNRSTGLYVGAANRPGWPLWQSGNIAPTFSDPGIYIADSASRTPAQSGVPAFLPGVAEQFASRYHDGDTSRYNGEGHYAGFPLGLQVEQNVYGFTQGELNATVILHYRVINVSDDTLRACYISGMFDPDLGRTTNNDAASFYSQRPELETAYAWSAGESPYPGTMAFTLLESPAIDNTTGSPSFGFVRHDKREYDPSEQIGLATVRNWTIDVDPRTPARYDFMSSGDLDGNTGSGDRRLLLASGPFHLAPGDTARMAIGLTIIPSLRIGTDGAQPLVEAAAERMITLYRQAPISSVAEKGDRNGKMTVGNVHPNPATGTTSIDLHLARRSDVRLQLVDALGHVVLARESVMEGGSQRLNLDLGGVAPGVYIISIEAAGERETRRVVVSH